MACNENETRITLNLARRRPLFRREDGTYPNTSTVYRWAFKGVRKVKLQITRVGGRILTTESSIVDFHEQLNASHTGVPSPSRKSQIESAQQRLAQDGIGKST